MKLITLQELKLMVDQGQISEVVVCSHNNRYSIISTSKSKSTFGCSDGDNLSGYTSLDDVLDNLNSIGIITFTFTGAKVVL